jgi:hypothetical protein
MTITEQINSKGFKVVEMPTPYVMRKVVDEDSATPDRIAKGPSVMVDGVRQMQDSLLDRLAEKGHLYPDAGMNAALKVAGEKYYEDWYGTGLSPLIAIDYGKVSGGGGGDGIGVGSIQTRCRDSYRAARKALTPVYRKAVEPILLEGQTDLVALGKALSGAASPHTCRAVALERFKAGLLILARHYVLLN